MDDARLGLAEPGRHPFGFDHGNEPAKPPEPASTPANPEVAPQYARNTGLRKKSAAIGYTLFDTAFGVCGIAWSKCGVVRLALPERTPAETETRVRRQAETNARVQPPRVIATIIRKVQRYFEGDAIDFSQVAIDLSAEPDFERRVYKALRGVSWGLTVSYGELAILADSPGAARAVGRAMAKNPLPVIVPCQRVLAAGGAIGGFSAHGGLATKQKMLALERITLPI
jgi:methylated-DNA-[protein]-cysteine S-methyltransferase